MPDTPIAKAYVTIKPDLSGFRDELRAGLDAEVDSLGPRTVRIDADTLEAKAKVDELDADLDELSAKDATPRVSVSDGDAKVALDYIQARIDMLSSEAATIRIGTTGSERTTIGDIQGALDQLRNETITPRVDLTRLEAMAVELDDLDARMHNLDTDMGDVSRSTDHAANSMGGLLGAVAVASPALIEMGVVGGAGLVGVATAAGAAALGVGAFGLAAEGSLSQAKAQATDLLNTWQSTQAAFTDPVVERALGSLPGIFDLLTPSVATTSVALQGLESDIAGSLGSPYLHEFSQYIAGEGGQAITSFGHLVGGLGHMLSGFTEGFAPELERIDADMVRWGADMRTWGDEAANGGLHSFIAYLQANGPLLAHTLEQVGSDVVTLARDSAPLGPIYLNILDVIARLVGDLEQFNPELTEWAVGLGSVAFAVNRLTSPLGGISGIVAGAPRLWGTAADAFTLGATGLYSVATASSGAAAGIASIVAMGALAVPGVDLLAASVLQATGVFSNFDDSISKSAQSFAQDFVDQLPAGTDKVAAVKAEIDQLNQSMQTWSGTNGMILSSVSGADWSTVMGTKIEDLTGKYATMKAALLNVADGTETVGQVFKGFYNSADQVDQKVQALQATLPGLTQAQNAQKEATDRAAQAEGEAAGYTGDMALQYGELSSQLKTANQALSQTETLLNNLLGMELSVAQSTDSFYSAVQNLTGSLHTNGTSMDETTAKGLANKQAFDGVASSIVGVIGSMEKQGATSDQIVGKVQTLTSYLESQAGKYGLTTAQVDQYLQQLGLTPSQVTTDLRLSGYSQASSQVSTITNQINNIPRSVTTILQIDQTFGGVGVSGTNAVRRAAATGMSSAAPGLATVAENGPELMAYKGTLTMFTAPQVADIPAGARIFTASQTAKMAHYADGVGNNLTSIDGVTFNVPVKVPPPVQISISSPIVIQGDATEKTVGLIQSALGSFRDELTSVFEEVAATR